MTDLRSFADRLSEYPPGAAADAFVAANGGLHIERTPDGSESATTGPVFLDDTELGHLPGVEWDIHEVLPTGGLSYLIGVRGTGKTLLAMDWACRVSLGLSWRGLAVIRRPVVYVAAEGARSLHSRLATWRDYHGHTTSSGVHWMPRRLLLRDHAAVQDFTRAITERFGRAGLTIIDTLPRCIQGAAENDPDGMGEALAAIDHIREAGWGALLVAHPSRDGGENPRGHSSQDGAADAIWVLKDHDGERLLTCSKNKDGDETASFSLTLVSHQNGVLLLPPEDAPVSRSLTPTQRTVLLTVRDVDHGTGVAAGVIIDTSRLPKASVYRALKTLVDRRDLTVRSQRYSLTPAGLLALQAGGVS